MRFGIAMVLAVGMSIVAGTPSLADAPRDAFQGVWQLSGGEADGKTLSESQIKDGKLVISGDRFTFTQAPVGTIRGTQQLGSVQELKTIDITNETGPHKGQTSLGIYEIDENEFRVVFAPPGGNRPSKFETASGSGQWLHTWKRIQQ